MNAGSHLATGALAGLVLAQSRAMSLQDTALIVGITAAAALLPDIDHPNATINRKLIVTKLVTLVVGHRGITHSVWVLALIAWIAVQTGLVTVLALWVGYACHILVDLLTQAGVRLLAPLSRRSIHLLPRPIRLRSGSWQEIVVIAGCMASAAALVFGGW